MSALQKSCLLACVLALGCGTDTKDTMMAYNPVGGDTNTGGVNATGGDPTTGGMNPTTGGDATTGGANATPDGGATTGGQANGDVDAGDANGGEIDGGATASGGEPDAGMTPVGIPWSPEPPLGASCNGVAKPGVTGPVPTFKRETISIQAGAAYLHPTDVNADGFPELLLTSLSEGIDLFGGIPPLDFGGAYMLKRIGGAPKGALGTWQTIKGFDKADKIGCPNSSEMFDVDGDGVDDWVIGAGFLLKPVGKIVWMKGSANGSFGKPQLITVPDTTCWYHVALAVDMDGDKDNDFVTSCHVGDTNNPSNGPSRVQWFENDGKGKFTVHPIGDGGGSLLSLYDVDGDGDQDVIAPQFFGPESMVWYEQTGAKGTTWVEHLISNDTGHGFIVKFADMNGDGKVDMLYGNHNNEEAATAAGKVMGIYWYDMPPAADVAGLTNWNAFKHTVYEGFKVDGTNNAESAGAPGMLNVGDIDGDCDMDVTVSGDGDLGLYVLLQQADKFQKVDLYTDPSNANSGEQHLIDLDGDGDLDIAWAVFGPSGGLSFSLNSHVYAFMRQ